MSLVKVLIVTDAAGGYRRDNHYDHKFHIGEFVKVLRDTDWFGFDVQIVRAHRDADPAPGTPPATHPVDADLYDFRFSAESLSGFDMCLFFSIARPDEDPVDSDASWRNEAAAIAAFMESGHGFFATGDHEDLGAAINQHVPRVRSMRRWTTGAGPHGGGGAPSGTGADRHDTLRAGSDAGVSAGHTYAYQFNDQSDDTPQAIRVASYPYLAGHWFVRTLPHPLLCSPLGRVNVLPDHMHEGWCEVPDDLTGPEDLPGRTGKPEYPLDSHGERVAPEVIAEADILAHETLNQEFGSLLSPMTSARRFGVIAAYDGHRANVGRVVVDATWHHFVNINVIGTNQTFAGLNPAKTKGFYTGPGDTPVPAYQKIMGYYRNLVYWLIPKNRHRVIWLDQLAFALRRNPRWEEYNGIAGRAEAIAALDLRDLLGFAQLAEGYFNSVRGYCEQYRLLPIVLEPIWRFDPHIWERFGPIFDPWNPATAARVRKARPVDGWREHLLPDAHLMRRVLLGTLAVAAVARIGRNERATEKHFADVQAFALQLLPRHLELADKALEDSAKTIRQARTSLSMLAEVAGKARAQAGKDATARARPAAAKKQTKTKSRPKG